MSAALPLVAAGDPGRAIAWRADGPISVGRFHAEVRALAARLPAGGAILNVCQDRYRFAVGLAAGLLAGKQSLLPAAHTPEMVRQLQAGAPDLFCLHDGGGEDIALPRFAFPSELVGDDPWPVFIDPAQPAVTLFTSGSTGLPTPHLRSWGALVRNGAAEAERLGLRDAGHAIVATVPAQHSYGLESTVLLALQGGCSFWAGRPYYPADIAAALAAVPRPRLLVTTPFHLRALLESGVAVPPVDMLLSATAPLSAALAGEAEQRLGAPLYEIYGCSESGQLASRRTCDTQRWTLFPGIRFAATGETCAVEGGHVEGRVPLSDLLEVGADGRFLLLGRHADMVNIAGKRSSVAYLSQQLLAIPGVEDGCFHLPEAAEAPLEAVTRLTAFVVAPTLASARILAGLRERIDPVFLPRPLIRVDRLPRNATGKLPRAALDALLESHRGGSRG
jgi:acyl-coenzyme A synthetase/AMP-(fatty) acid ligase